MDCEKIGNFIRQNRNAKKLTQKQLADKLCVTDRAVSRWERGVGTPDISLLVSLGEILGVSVNEILLGEKIDNITKEQSDKILIDSISMYRKNDFKILIERIFLIVIMVSFLITAIALFNISMIVSNLSIHYLFLIFGGLFISLLAFTKLSNDYQLKRKFVKTACLVYSISLVFYFFYTGISYKINGVNNYAFSYNLVPFKQIYENFYLVVNNAQSFSLLFDYVIVDLCLFVPYSFFIPYLKTKISFIEFFIIMFLIITMKELFQLITGFGVFDINDIILNLIGVSLAFYLIMYLKFNNN